MLKLENLNETISSYKARIDGTSKTLGLRAKVEMGDQSKERALESTSNMIRRNEEQRQIMNDFDRTAGHVYATSGYRSVPDSQGRHWALNWSLTRVLPTRIMENIATSHVGVKTDFLFWHKITPLGRQVAKLGRSTGWTTGTVNAAEIVFSSSSVGDKRKDTEVSPYKKNVYAWPVIAAPGSLFALSDDSGAVVFDTEHPDTMNYWVGFLFAANTATGVGFFTPIEFVLNDVASVTGCEILEPTLQT